MIPGSIHPLLAGATSYLVQNSLRFKSASSGLLARTIGSSSTSTTTCTLSFWIKRGAFGSGRQTIFYTGNSSGTLNMIMIEFTSGSQLLAYYNGAGSTGFTTSAVFRDPSAWYHIVHAYDSTQATDSNRIKLYINGNQNSSFSSINYPALNQAFSAGAADIQRMMGFITTQFVDGYLAESHFVDGQALTPSSFGETDNVTGVWVPKKYTGTYGTNGFYLEFKDASAATNTAIGKDSSGNGNHFTPSGVSVTSGNTFDQMVDTPTLNYATWSPIDTRGSAIPTAGNLNPGVGNSQGVRATIGVTSGKWYWEHRLATASTDYTAGITNQEPLGTYLGSDTNSIGYAATGNVLRNASVIATYGNWNTSGKIVAFALDQDNKTIQMFVDGVSQNAAFAHLLTGTIFPAINFGTGYGTPVGITNFGQQPFTYTPPTGFKALNSSNFSVPTILKSSSYFDTITRTGTGAAATISSLNFQPDLVWIKSRSATTNNNIFDSSRGVGNTLVTNTTSAEVSNSNTLTSFTSTGYTLGQDNGSKGVNINTNTYVDWSWKKGATPGFDIVTYGGTGSAQTLSHNLGVVPSMMIVKNRTGLDRRWTVYHKSIPNSETGGVYLDLVNAWNSDSTLFNNTAPTSSQFTVGSYYSAVGETYVMYLWSEVADFSKFGSYLGNASTDGPFVWCGFRPKWVMIKAYNLATYFMIWSSYNNNEVVSMLIPTLTNSEGSNVYGIDILSSGFKVRAPTGYSLNNSGYTYIFAAFAETPFKYARAR